MKLNFINRENVIYNLCIKLYVSYQNGVERVYCNSKLDGLVRFEVAKYNNGHKRLRKRQLELLRFIFFITKDNKFLYNTHELNQKLKNNQTYETLLRNRLFKIIPYVEPRERRSSSGHLISRTWMISDLGRELLITLGLDKPDEKKDIKDARDTRKNIESLESIKSVQDSIKSKVEVAAVPLVLSISDPKSKYSVKYRNKRLAAKVVNVPEVVNVAIDKTLVKQKVKLIKSGKSMLNP